MAFDFGAAGGGAAEGLEQVLRRLFLEAQQRQQAELARESMGVQRRGQDITARGQDLDAEAAQGRLGLGRDELGLRREDFEEGKRQFGIEQPIRGRFMTAQSANLEREPLEQADARAHAGMMQERQQLDRIALEKERGGQDRATARFKSTLEPKTPTQPVSDAYQAERNTRIIDAVNALDQKVGPGTVGPGSILSKLPGTPARNFEAELNSLKSNIGFKELAEMRAASKTGGALGQVSDRELTLLTSAMGALDSGQSPAHFKQQLQKIRDSIQRWEAAKANNGQAPAQQPGAQEFDYVPGKGLVPRGGGR